MAKTVRVAAFAALAIVATPFGYRALAQVPIDTTKFAQAVPVAGDIPGLYKWENSRVSDSATVKLTAPTEGQHLRVGDSVFVTVSVSGVAIGAQTQFAEFCGLANSGQGQHTHVIVDNEPYVANYATGQPFNIGVLSPGVHTVRVFASRSWHESIKSPGSFKSVTFFVGDSSMESPILRGDPLLTYSRPKGTYTGDEARAIMVDFYLRNVVLSPDGYKVRLTVDGKSTLLTDWVPYLVTGLTPGDHVFKLELLHKDGKLVAGKYNSTERKIVIKEKL
jgi:hypothetical protein